jgi:hypothetical protein
VGDERFTFGNRADLNQVAALMDIVEQIRCEGDVGEALAAGEEAGLSSELLATLGQISPDESDFLIRLVGHLKSGKLYDDYNPRLYYL